MIAHAVAVELVILILSESASIYPYFVYADSKGSGESAHLQDSSEPSFFDTAMSTTST